MKELNHYKSVLTLALIAGVSYIAVTTVVAMAVLQVTATEIANVVIN